MKSFRLEDGWQSVKDFAIGIISLAFWGFVIIGGASLFFGDDGSSVSSGSSGGYPYNDDYHYEREEYEPDFDDYKHLIDADSVEACSSSGCYELEADVSDGVVNTIHFDNGGYRELGADIDSDGSAYGIGSRGDEWEIQVSEDEIDEAREQYLENETENEYDEGEYGYYYR